MPQSSVIFANLFIAYLIFITMRGELPVYIDLLRGGGAINTVGAPSNSGPSILGNNAGQPITGIEQLSNSLPPLSTDWLTQLTGG